MTTLSSSFPHARRVLVTGGNGYLGSWIVCLLLAEGHQVHVTVRSLSDRSRYAHLLTLDGAVERLSVFAASLDEAGSFDAAMQGCDTVLHVASPFAIEGIEDPQRQLINPAVNGTRHVLEAANRIESVRRVVLTSSVAAIYGDATDKRAKGEGFSETDWNTTSSLQHQPYAFSKTLAEREAWRIAGRQSRWSLVALNPGFMLGPAVRADGAGVSQTIMRRFADGTYKSGMVNVWYGFVDVRDVAEAHVKAAFAPNVSGRFVLVGENGSLLQVAQLLRARFDRYPLPRREAPKAILWLFPKAFGFTRRYVSANVGKPLKLENQRSRDILHLHYRPLAETVYEHFQQAAGEVSAPKATARQLQPV